ncbi:MAG: restriction endonuclease subunit S [Negativicutes bacterium]
MKHKPYPKYRDSGVEWFGEVPAGWEVKPLKMVANIRYGIGEPPEYVDDGIPLIRATNVNSGKIEKANLVMVDPQEIPAGRIIWLKAGDIIVVRSGAYTGDSAIIPSEFEGAIAGFDMVLTTRKLNSQFLSYILLSRFMKEGQLDLEKMRAAQPHLNAAELGSCFVLCPTLFEQQAIAIYLDHKTGKIDNLIDKKQELVKRLREKRSALISHAVTQGLDPKVKMKPSGVAWWGNVPEHWTVTAIKRIVGIPVTDGPHETPEILDEGVPFISAEAIRDNKIDFSRKRGFISEEEHRRFCRKYKPKRDDIYMIKSGATTGNIAIVETDEEFSIWSPLAVVRADLRKAEPRYLLAAMNSKEFQSSVQLFWSFGTQQNIGMSVIENLVIPVPPLLSEQQAIAAFIDCETGKIDALVTKVEEAIGKLKEYRSALISAAVTGKIDVREAK